MDCQQNNESTRVVVNAYEAIHQENDTRNNVATPNAGVEGILLGSHISSKEVPHISSEGTLSKESETVVSSLDLFKNNLYNPYFSIQ